MHSQSQDKRIIEEAEGVVHVLLNKLLCLQEQSQVHVLV